MFGATVERYEEIDSTNRRAIEWAREGAPEGALVVADHQTKGRGRRGRSWLSRPGSGLLFSIVLRRGIEEPGQLTTALGVGVARGLEKVTGLSAGLKWPNDVLLQGKKVAGILVEAVSGQGPPAAVAGIGINLSWEDEMPTEIAGRATSLEAALRHAGRPGAVERDEVLSAVLEEVESALGEGSVLDEARARSTLLGHDVVVRLASGEVVEGRAGGLREDGALILEGPGGPEAVVAGEVEKVEVPPDGQGTL